MNHCMDHRFCEEIRCKKLEIKHIPCETCYLCSGTHTSNVAPKTCKVLNAYCDGNFDLLYSLCNTEKLGNAIRYDKDVWDYVESRMCHKEDSEC